MGRSKRPRPDRLAEKLLRIRLTLGLSLHQMFERLNYQKSPFLLSHISHFELDRREPVLTILLRYARVADISLEILADDELDLPDRFPSLDQLTQVEETAAPIECPHCKTASKQIKAGRNHSGSRRYQCRHCLRHHTPQPEGGYRHDKPTSVHRFYSRLGERKTPARQGCS